jgi:hypothetical protein
LHIINPEAPRLAADLNIREKAEALRDEAAALTPVVTGALRAAWQVSKNRAADYDVSNDVPYARFVEYGTSRQAPAAMMGRALAKERAR